MTNSLNECQTIKERDLEETMSVLSRHVSFLVASHCVSLFLEISMIFDEVLYRSSARRTELDLN